MKTKKVSMLDGPILPNIIRYTIPIILTSLLQVFYNAADLAIVGRFCGSLSVAAVGATGSITNLILNLFIGLSVGSGVAVAHGIGCDNKKTVHRTVHTAVPAAIISGVVLTTVGVLLSNTLLQMMDTPENILPLSTLYMRIIFCGSTFSMVYNFCSSILRAVGDTKSPLIFLSISGLINVLLNIIFVTVIDMNVAGVALATIISQAISAVLVVMALMKRQDACKLVLKEMKIYKDELLRIIKIGLPAGIQGSLFAISNVVIQSSVNSFGDIFVSGSSAASNLEGFVYVCLNSFHQTAVNFIGQNLGAKQHDRVKKIYWTCLGCVAFVGLFLGCTVRLFGRQLLGIYITDSDLAITYGLIRITYTCIPYFLCGMMDVTTGALRGLGSSLPPMIISIIGVCGIRLFWVYTIFQIPSLHSPECLFTSYTISWLTSFIIQLFVFLSLHKKISSTSV
ncbi:MAG: MATE family efflux transporter [Ruminococcaceae bacterium]|nr:MATE family efflux transporter [Oscillospiraceae bacterium]